MSKGKHSSQYKQEKSKKRSVENDETVQNINNLGENIKELFNKAVEDWKAKYDSEILALKMELEEVKKSQDFISTSYEKLKNRCEQLVETNQNQEEQIRKLKAQANELESCNEKEKVDFLDQYGRRLNLEIIGVPFKKGENTNQIVMEVAKLLDITITDDQISTSHRLQPRIKRDNTMPTVSPPIIVRFVSRDVGNNVYFNRKLIRTADLKNFSVAGTSSIFIKKNLTQSRKKLFWRAKQIAKCNVFKYYWTTNGNVFVRKSSETTPLLIKSEDDLASIK